MTLPCHTSTREDNGLLVVGRASQVILAEQRDVLHVRIIAPFEKRVAYVMQPKE